MERTMEEKIKRLEELSEYSTMLEEWLLQAKTSKNKEQFMSYTCKNTDSVIRIEHAQTTWDVHTGVAFTKLYKALK